MEKVLVTGASGFIATHCIKELIKAGYSVRGSLRNLKREEEVRKSIGEHTGNKKIEFCKLDLLEDEGWDHAASDCNYLIHIASPFTLEEPKKESLLISPALEGTLRALKAAKNSNIKKVVLTSSMAAIAYNNRSYATDWTDLSKEVGAYIKSKTLAECCSDFINKNNENSFTLTTIHPEWYSDHYNDVYGAGRTNFKNDKWQTCSPDGFTVVDVRDVAKLQWQP